MYVICLEKLDYLDHKRNDFCSNEILNDSLAISCCFQLETGNNFVISIHL